MADALPPIDSAQIPAAVRAQGPAAQKLYGVALSFEQMLTQEIAQALLPAQQDGGEGSSDAGDSGDPGGDASTSMVQQLLPTALAQGMTQAGGLGLADQLFQSLGGTTAPATAAKAGR
jgi:Rod binding domain-containing protein